MILWRNTNQLGSILFLHPVHHTAAWEDIQQHCRWRMEAHICTAAHSPSCRTCLQADIQGQKAEQFRELYNELVDRLGKEILSLSPGNIVHYVCSHMYLPSHTCHHWVHIQGHTHIPPNRVQCTGWVEEGYRRAGKETRRRRSGCWVGM